MICAAISWRSRHAHADTRFPLRMSEYAFGQVILHWLAYYFLVSRVPTDLFSRGFSFPATKPEERWWLLMRVPKSRSGRAAGWWAYARFPARTGAISPPRHAIMNYFRGSSRLRHDNDIQAGRQPQARPRRHGWSSCPRLAAAFFSLNYLRYGPSLLPPGVCSPILRTKERRCRQNMH